MSFKKCPYCDSEKWFDYEDFITHMIGKQGHTEIQAKGDAQGLFY